MPSYVWKERIKKRLHYWTPSVAKRRRSNRVTHLTNDPALLPAQRDDWTSRLRNRHATRRRHCIWATCNCSLKGDCHEKLLQHQCLCITAHSRRACMAAGQPHTNCALYLIMLVAINRWVVCIDSCDNTHHAGDNTGIVQSTVHHLCDISFVYQKDKCRSICHAVAARYINLSTKRIIIGVVQFTAHHLLDSCIPTVNRITSRYDQ